MRSLCVALVTLIITLPFTPGDADAQFRRLRDRAKKTVEREVGNATDRLLAEAIRCALDDPRCVEQAQADGKEVIYTDQDGEVITDDEGVPITDRNQAQAAAGGPGTGPWTNYDFVPGERVLFAENFADDRVGDFPRRLEFVKGNMQVVEWQGGRYLQATAASEVKVPLPETLPEKFTIEFDLKIGAPHMSTWVELNTHEGSTASNPSAYFQFFHTPGVTFGGTSLSGARDRRIVDEVTPVRIHVDGTYAKVYIDEARVANVPNANFVLSDHLFLTFTANPDYPTYLGNVVVAAGGSDLYDDLIEDGTAVTRGILFDVDSDRLRAESTPTLDEIGRMLTTHADLKIEIGGHTDGTGDEAHNADLSNRRANAVRQFLISRYDIDANRMTAHGYGESTPVAPNETLEGRQQNRRVELKVID